MHQNPAKLRLVIFINKYFKCFYYTLDQDGDNSNINLSVNKTDPNDLCSICGFDRYIVKFTCGEGCCRECLSFHLENLLGKYKLKVFSPKITFICCAKCKCEQSTSLIESLMEKRILTLYHEVLLKMYLVKSDDLISCPNSNCSNYNFIDKKNSRLSQFLCKMTECIKCSECGAEYSHNTMNIFNLKFFLNLFSINNLKSKFLKYIITKHCNNCNTPIEKGEGCKHMECNRCGYSFCWKCTCDWNGHNELCCMGLSTNIYDDALRKDYQHIVLIFLLIVMTLKLIFAFDILLYIFTLLIKVTIFWLMLGSDLTFLEDFNGLYSTSWKKAFLLCLFYFPYSISLYYYRLHPFSERVYLFLQIFVLFTASLVDKYKKRILRR